MFLDWVQLTVLLVLKSTGRRTSMRDSTDDDSSYDSDQGEQDQGTIEDDELDEEEEVHVSDLAKHKCSGVKTTAGKKSYVYLFLDHGKK